MIPALQAMMSRRPNAATARSTSEAQALGSETSVWTEIARPPACLISSAADCASAALREVVTTAAPASAMPLAIARPSPRPEPVTMATLPARLKRERDIDLGPYAMAIREQQI